MRKKTYEEFQWLLNAGLVTFGILLFTFGFIEWLSWITGRPLRHDSSKALGSLFAVMSLVGVIKAVLRHHYDRW